MQTGNYSINEPSMSKLFDNLAEKGKTMYAPKNRGERILFQKVEKFGEIAGDYLLTANSAKEVVFPRYEKVFSYKKTQDGILINDPTGNPFSEVVLWGSRPCDAAAFIPMTNTFATDYIDNLYVKRRKNLLVLSFSCNTCDEFCFCTSVNGGPGNTAGSDILFTRLQTGDFLAEIITEKGKKVVEENSSLFEASTAEGKEQSLAKVEPRFNQDEIQAKLQELFENPLWAEKSRACLGCGTCAYICPVCSCFDIQDEAHGSQGTRLRCWDSCGFSLFTLHTSGHNPRPDQGTRWRQRILHKFRYMPDKSKIAGCVGCGRCSRSCPAGINILDTVTAL